MYVYIMSEPGLWTVGFYDPQGKFHPESDHSSTDEARARVHYLNGGSPPPKPEPKGRTVERRGPMPWVSELKNGAWCVKFRMANEDPIIRAFFADKVEAMAFARDENVVHYDWIPSDE